ncbi:MAG: peptide chain release factor N(5)-glutamine methyltransferase [Alphaproteobacteria bacterium]|nr:peptide chain release factor N(5)-glutamine methyltransferase [Alphaproteobacteria bacterium]
MTIRDLLHDAADRLRQAGVDSGRRDARILLAWAMRISREQLIAADRRPSQEEAEAFRAMIDRRVAREPVAYITGRKEFWSLEFTVGPGVLIPRPDTETLIETALSLFPDRAAPIAIADLGTGSGALLVAALKEFPQARGWGFERSPEALRYARANLEAHGLGARAEILAADWTAAPAAGFDLVLSNPPYIPTAEIGTLEAEVRAYEPRAALDGGPDGLDSYRSLAAILPRLLRPGATALLELGQGQFAAVEPLFQDLQTHPPVPDLAGIPRVLVLKRPK